MTFWRTPRCTFRSTARSQHLRHSIWRLKKSCSSFSEPESPYLHCQAPPRHHLWRPILAFFPVQTGPWWCDWWCSCGFIPLFHTNLALTSSPERPSWFSTFSSAISRFVDRWVASPVFPSSSFSCCCWFHLGCAWCCLPLFLTVREWGFPAHFLIKDRSSH